MPEAQLVGSVVVVTGGASGIGRELAARFAAEGARAVVVTDRNGPGAEAVAAALSSPVALGLGLDVTDEAAVQAAIERVETEVGPIDIWLSNAGVGDAPGLGTDDQWDLAFGVHVLAHVYAARHVLPRMVDRGRGHFMITASAAGLLTQMDSAAYTVTKHGSVALAEWLSIRYGDKRRRLLLPVPAGRADRDDRRPGGAVRDPGRRRLHRHLGCGGRGSRGPRRRAVPDPAAS